jgi:hypothetical protein
VVRRHDLVHLRVLDVSDTLHSGRE